MRNLIIKSRLKTLREIELVNDLVGKVHIFNQEQQHYRSRMENRELYNLIRNENQADIICAELFLNHDIGPDRDRIVFTKLIDGREIFVIEG